MHNKEEICKKAIDYYGAASQIHKAVTECALLIAALQQYSSPKDIVDRIADVKIIICQLEIILGQGRCELAEIEKLKRLSNRMVEL